MRSLSSYLEPPYSIDKGINHGKRLLPQVLDELAAEDPDHIIGMIANPGSMPTLTFTPLSSSQMANAVNFTSQWLSELLDKDPYETISFIGIQDFRYWVMTLAAIKTGHPLLLAGPGNAIPNNVCLLNGANCDVIFYSGGGSFLEAHVEDLQSVMSSLRIYEIPSLEQMVAVRAGDYPYSKTYDEAKNDTVLILHTSGSTGKPKPIRYNNAFLSRTDYDVVTPVPPGTTLAGSTLVKKKGFSYFGAPLFHVSGSYLLATALFKASTTILGPPDRPPSGEVACAVVRSLKLTGIFAVPFIQDAIFRENGEELKDQLLELDHVCSFGGPLRQATGEWIVQNLPNTVVWQGYGYTENNIPLMLVPPKSHWSYIEFHPTLGPHLERISPASDLYEVVFRPHPDLKYAWSRPVFQIFPHLDEWRPGDLFKRCEDEGFEHLWKFQSRTDDLMILSKGTKVNPVHIEIQLMNDPAVKGTLMFGDGRTVCGILLEPKTAEIEKDELVRTMWPAIQKANFLDPEHARVEKSLIIVASTKKPFARAAKGTIIRKATLEMYETEIQEAYKEAGFKSSDSPYF